MQLVSQRYARFVRPSILGIISKRFISVMIARIYLQNLRGMNVALNANIDFEEMEEEECLEV